MRFQGEICTLSFGLHFNKGQVMLNGTLWPRRSATADLRQHLPRLRFNALFAEEDIINLQQWLLTDDPTPLNLPTTIRQVRRLPNAGTDMLGFELELDTEEPPAWWNWPVRFPLCVQLEIRSNEFSYLTRSLARDHWSTADLTW